MTSPYECEVRFPIHDLKTFLDRIEKMGGRVLYEYRFTDHYFRPSSGHAGIGAELARWGRDWSLPTTLTTLRIREWFSPKRTSEVLLTKVEVQRRGNLTFKRSTYPEGKITLYEGPAERAVGILADLGYEPWLSIRKTECAMMEIPGWGHLIREYIDGLGWMSEVEVAGESVEEAAERLQSKLEVLGVDVQETSPEPLVVLYARHLGLLPRESQGRIRVYFAGAIRGGRQLQHIYQLMVSWLQERGVEVLTPHVADPEVLVKEASLLPTPEAIYHRDMSWLVACDLVVAEVTVPSLGVGIELATAATFGKPILAFCQEGTALSALVAGNPHIHVIWYREVEDLRRKLDEALPRYSKP
ncbi:MAG: nucleoside 2-deoxyribosyltransferase [Armatimonadota bacterium]|nr:nucleoside 2-deoxyribosyltransferase [Armatimonadota bacterium]